MEIWSFLNSKGGVGKSTIAINVAHFLMFQQFKVCIVDADQQGSIRDWQDAKGSDASFLVVGLDRRETLKNLKQVIDVDYFDYCLIDTPGSCIEIQATAIALSKKIFIPVPPSLLDIWATSNVVELIKARQQALEGTKDCPAAAFFMTRVKKNTIVSRETRETLTKEYGLPVLKTLVHGVVDFASNVTIFDSKSKAGLAGQKEIAELTNELIEFEGDANENASE